MNQVLTTKGETKKRHKSIGLKVGIVTAVMQTISVVLAMTICIFTFNSLVTRMLEQRCTNGTNILARELSRAADGEDLNRLLDDLKSLMGCEFTIFEGDTRAYSTVMQNGERVVGTHLSSELNTIVLQQGQSYVGEADILGISYLCSYVPTRGSDGQVNGLIFSGISKAEAAQETRDVTLTTAIVSLAVIVFCIILMSAYLKKQVSTPLGRITQAAQRLENGDLGLSDGRELHVNVRSNDEIGALGQIFEDTVRRLKAYIGEISEVLSRIADGILTQSARQEYLGDFLSIKTSLDSIQAKLNSTMGQIASSAELVSAGSDQVSDSAQELAQGAAEQASSVEEISATISDISKNARQTSDTAAEAGEFVNQAGAQLNTCIDCVHELNTAMEHISGSTEKISTIIAAMENIAFQINILSLNASVEAARAGAAGRGFAVVAEEVRSLSAKSDEAAKATRELIESSITAVGEGSQALRKVNASLEQTNRLAGNVTSRMSTVVDSVERQTAALDQVNRSIDLISDVVQTNAATSEECAASSEEMSSQAALLKNLLSSFRLQDSHR